MGGSPAGGPGLKAPASKPSPLQKQLRPCKAQALGDPGVVEKGRGGFWEGWAGFPARGPWRACLPT